MTHAPCLAGVRGIVLAPRARRGSRPAARSVVPVRASRDVRGLDSNYDGDGSTILVTGGATGIGLEACKQLYTAGCRVLVSARSAEKARSAVDIITSEPGAGTAEPVVLDLANLQSVRACAATLVRTGTRLGAVVCNAGVAPDRAGNRVSALGAPRRTADGFEETVGVNHLGHFALVLALAPVLGPGTRVVITSSCVHDAESPDGRNGAPPTLGDLSGLASGHNFDMCDGGKFDGNKAYKDSKLCGILFARELARRLGDVGATCNAFSPGFVPTSGLFRHQSAPVRALLRFAFDHPPLSTSMKTAGRFTTHMVLGREPGATTGAYFCGPPSYTRDGENQVGGFLRGWLEPEFGVKEPSVEACDDGLARRLWNISEELVGERLADVGSVLERRRAASPSPDVKTVREMPR